MNQNMALVENIDLLAGAFLLLGLPFFIVEMVSIVRNKTATWHRISGVLTSLFCMVPVGVAEALTVGFWFAGFYGVAQVAPAELPVTLFTAAICLLAVDFLYYWEHRIAHQVNLLWASSHSVHHSADHFDQSVAGRGSIFDFVWTPLFYLPLVVIGFDPLLVFACYGLMLAWQQWIHTETIGLLPLLDPWLNTPSNHRVHHGRNPEYLDKNYGGILMVWDRLFGSYQSETAAVDYGLVGQLKSRNPWTVQVFVLNKLIKDLRAARSWGQIGKLIFGRPDQATAQQNTALT